MAKHRKKSVRYYNGETGTWSDTSDMQFDDNIPVKVTSNKSKDKKEYDKINTSENEQQTDDVFDTELEISKQSQDKTDISTEKQTEISANVNTLKFIKRRKKERIIEKTEKIIEDGINKDVDIDGGVLHDLSGVGSNYSDKLVYDDGINTDDYQSKMIRSYKSEFKNACENDNNNDGQVDEDDWTPGMKKMSRYM